METSGIRLASKDFSDTVSEKPYSECCLLKHTKGKTMANRMRDVAKRAGVSIGTVSHVLNKTRCLAPETRKQVQKVVGELRYVKNAHARRLAHCGI